MLSDTKCLTIDMVQNVPFPIEEIYQLSDAYYMIPLNIYLFDINDNAIPNVHDHMNAYIWSGEDGRQGDNNLVSGLFSTL